MAVEPCQEELGSRSNPVSAILKINPDDMKKIQASKPRKKKWVQ